MAGMFMSKLTDCIHYHTKTLKSTSGCRCKMDEDKELVYPVTPSRDVSMNKTFVGIMFQLLLKDQLAPEIGIFYFQ